MPRRATPIRSDIAWSTADRITVRGLDLPSEVLGHLDLGAMSFLQLTGRRPTEAEARLYNAMLVALVEHGMTPSAIAARMTYAGAPESLQAAVAAGIAGLGTVFVGSMEGAARMLSDALANAAAPDLDEVARVLVTDLHGAGEQVSGLGHPLHKPVDPRTARLEEIAAETGFDGQYVELMRRVSVHASTTYGRELPINATGIIGALSCELGFPWQVVRGFGVMARAIGLVGHLMEEREQPMATELWQRVEDEATEHLRPS